MELGLIIAKWAGIGMMGFMLGVTCFNITRIANILEDIRDALLGRNNK